jgi:N-dimethylarginine dimethylaminohydrolase
MRPSDWQAHSVELFKQAQISWEAMYKVFLSMGISVQLVPPAAGLPDLVFTANAAIVLDGKVLLSHFRHVERQGEEVHFAEFFGQLKEAGVVGEISRFPDGIFQEGAGDCHWDVSRQIFWAGYGPRSSREAIPHIENYFGKSVIALELASDEFYHIDVALRPLTGGEVLYYPGAFTKESLSILADQVPADQLIAADHDDAANFACNAVNLMDKIILCRCSSKLEAQLSERGYTVIKVPVETFALSGGSVFCMTLRLDWRSLSF